MSREDRTPAVIVLMGVAGAGKTTVGRRLAESLGWPFADADAFHSAANVEKMRRGVPLTDDDRSPWLAALRAQLRDTLAHGGHLVLACSALRRIYRDALVPAESADVVRLVYLDVPRAELAHRLTTRVGHYAPATLLDSQLATLEPPAPDEHIPTIDASGSVDATVAAIRAAVLGDGRR